MDSSTDPMPKLRRALLAASAEAHPGESLQHLAAQGLDALPLPGAGRTAQRWRLLAAVAAHDLALVKLFEGHTDALAILSELRAKHLVPRTADGTNSLAATWAVWASEAAGHRLELRREREEAWLLYGTKSWCSGAPWVSHALVTAWCAGEEAPRLAAVAVRQPAVERRHDGWRAVGMARSDSIDVDFKGASAIPIGLPGAYLSRPGFWQGGAGIAACWFGGAQGLAQALRTTVEQEPDASAPWRRAALGRVDVLLSSAAAVLREAADWIDANPTANAQGVALRTRLVCEHTAQAIHEAVGRALGAAPFGRDRQFARLAADLPVYMRQSHAERDLEALGRWVSQPAPRERRGAPQPDPSGWRL